VSIREFYPFRTRPDSIKLQLLPVQEQVRSSSDGSLLMYELASNHIAINVLIDVPETILNDVLDVSEKEDPPVKVVLTCMSVESRRRTSISLNRSSDGCRLESQMEFQRDDWRGAVEFRAYLVRSKDNPGLPDGYASKKGAKLAWSESVRLMFDEPRLPPGDHLRIIWKDFAKSEEWLQRQRNHLFALETSSDDIATVILNQGVPHAYQVLSSTASSGKIARIRDATYYLIVHQVWSLLIAETLFNIAKTRMGDEEKIDLVLDELPAWQQSLLRDWAPKLYHEEDGIDDALSSLISTTIRAGGDWRDLLYRRLPEAIQRQYRTWQVFSGLVQEVAT